MTATTVRCPTCGKDATVDVDRRDTGGTVVGDYRCPTGCRVDGEAIRQIIGTSDN